MALASCWILAAVAFHFATQRPEWPGRRTGTLLALAVVLFILGGLLAAGFGNDFQRRQTQQADFLARAWGITVVDVDALPGLTPVHDVPIRIDSSSGAGGARQQCALTTFFGNRHGEWVDRKPGRGDGNRLMLFRLACPAPFTTDAEVTAVRQ